MCVIIVNYCYWHWDRNNRQALPRKQLQQSANTITHQAAVELNSDTETLNYTHRRLRLRRRRYLPVDPHRLLLLL
jgi:hypothetical protein